MRVPHKVVGRTRPSAEGLTYLRPADFTGLGRGVSEGLSALGALGASWEQRQEQFQRFQGLTDLTEFETLVGEQLTAMKRDAKVNIANFPMQAEVAFEKQRAEFLNKRVPTELQEEFNYRTGLIKQRVVGDALTFQYASQDQFFATEMSKRFDESRLRLSKATDTKAALEEEQKFLAEHLSSTALSTQDKVKLAREYNIGLQAVIYQREYMQKKLATETETTDDVTVARKIIGNESSGRADAKNTKSSATGFAQYINTTWLSSIKKHLPDVAVGKSEAELLKLRSNKEVVDAVLAGDIKDYRANLETNGFTATQGNLYLSHFAGTAGAVALLRADPNTPVENVLSPAAIKANLFLRGKTTGEVVAWAAKKMGGPAPDIDNDPRFGQLPYETRLALQKDGDKAVTEMLAANAKAEKERYDALYNALRNGIIDGTKGMRDIDEAYNGGQGWLTKYSDRQSAIDAFETKNKEAKTLLEAQQMLADPASIWGDENQKHQNALFQQNGREALTNNDPAYAHALAAMAAQTKDVPTDAVDLLGAMTRSSDNNRMLYAYNTLGMLQAQAPEAFQKRAGEGLIRDLEYWRMRKDSLPAEELAKGLRGGVTQEERQQRLVLRKEAQDFLLEKKKGVPTVQELAHEFVADYGSLLGSDPAISNVPWAARGLYRDFQVAFVDAYERLGNTDEATQLAKDSLKRQYSVTSVGGALTLMKRPPEKAGYGTIGGKFDWIEGQAREELGLGDEQFQLLSDDQTEQEFDRWQRGDLPRKPSYLAAVKTERGWAMQFDENGKPKRIWFQPSEIQLLGDEVDFRLESLQQERVDANKQYVFDLEAAGTNKEKLDEVKRRYREREEGLRREIEEVIAIDPRRTSEETQSPDDEMLKPLPLKQSEIGPFPARPDLTEEGEWKPWIDFMGIRIGGDVEAYKRYRKAKAKAQGRNIVKDEETDEWKPWIDIGGIKIGGDVEAFKRYRAKKSRENK